MARCRCRSGHVRQKEEEGMSDAAAERVASAIHLVEPA